MVEFPLPRVEKQLPFGLIKVRNGFVPHLRREVAHYLVFANDSLLKESVKSLSRAKKKR
jgi:hypothetical protein